MGQKRFLKRLFTALALLIIVFFVWLSFTVFPDISGFGSKNLCSAFYLQHRNPDDVRREDLGDFPKSLGKFKVNENDSSVTGSVWGVAKSKAIYRKECGCTLVNDISEDQIRRQQFSLP